MSVGTYTVTGMTCGHCADPITEEVSTIEGVRTVYVGFASGQVTVISDTPVAIDDIRAAVTEAGYQLVTA
jgi:copper chaperone CopZ